MLVGADRCLGDVVTEMLSTIEDSDDPHDEAHVYLVTLFPQFAHIFAELKEVCGACSVRHDDQEGGGGVLGGRVLLCCVFV